MVLDYRTLNALWGSILVETLARLGLTHGVICPGSRSTPITYALAQHPQIQTVPILDERSAAFFALGLAQRRHQPVAVVCSSGTAGANFYPALIEAKESQIPLLLMTADRPPELRECGSGQTIDQIKLFGTYPNWQIELMVPSAQIDHLTYLRQQMVQIWERCLWPIPGPVHVNLPFRDPLAPVADLQGIDRDLERSLQLDEEDFFAQITPPVLPQIVPTALPWSTWRAATRGLIIAGPAHPSDPERYCRAVAILSRHLGWPLIAAGLSPLRHFAQLNPALISTYDLILRHPERAQQLQPSHVIQLGSLPTSKVLRGWLQTAQALTWAIDPSPQGRDPGHGRTISLRCSIESLAGILSSDPDPNLTDHVPAQGIYRQHWLQYEAQARHQIQHTFNTTEDWIESRIPWELAHSLPVGTPLFIANSLAVRDVEWIWPPNSLQIRPCFNRGANGIDGTLSTALGVAEGDPGVAAVLLTGDLAFLHDSNGLLIRPHLRGHLTVVVINNQGGGIFELLPIAQFDPPFEDYFATPQSVDLRGLCHSCGVEYEPIHTWTQLRHRLNPLPQIGIRVLELKTDRKLSAQWRQRQFQLWSHQIGVTPAERSDPLNGD